MAHSRWFLSFIVAVSFLEGSLGEPFGETSNDVNKKDCGGSSQSLSAGFNTNVLDKLGAGQNLSLKVQLPSFQVDPNFAGALKWQLPKLTDIFKGFKTVGNINGGLNISKNPFGDMFKSSNSLGVFNGSVDLPNAAFKLQLPSFQTNTNLTGASIFNPSKLNDFFKGFSSLGSINGGLNLNSNALPDINGALKPLADIFNSLKSIKGDANFNIKGINNLKETTIDPNFMKVLNCLIEFTKSLNVDFQPVKNFVKGLKGITIPPNLINNLTNGQGNFKIDSSLLQSIASWVNNLKVGLQIDPVKVEEILGGVEGLAEINGFLAPYIQTIVGGLGALDTAAIAEVIEGILALLLVL